MIGTGELILIFCVILLLFGGKKLPELAKSLGRGLREFKKACNETESPSGSCCQHKEKKCCLESEDVESTH